MTSPRKSQVAAIERQVLSAMCQGCTDGALSAATLRRLQNYTWREPEHEALFRALSRFRSSPAERLREQLAAQLTRLGFPDIRWDDLLLPHGLTVRDAERLIRGLLALG